MNKKDDIGGMVLDLGRLIRKEMIAHGEKGQSPLCMHALSFIEEKPGITMSEFASHMNISPSTATSFIERLVRDKLVKRKADATNRKVVHISLTPLGTKEADKHRTLKKIALKNIFKDLSATDREHLQRIFSLLISTSK